MNLQLQSPDSLEIVYRGTFCSDILDGLGRHPKKLLSKYFYDDVGGKLFQRIMAMPEYYLTKCELDIFKNKTAELIDAIALDDSPFDLIELGAGDALKSSYLLQALVEKGVDFTYMPIDISGDILSVLQERLSMDLPELNINLLEGEYFEMLDKATIVSERRKVVLFLGGNIGNMEPTEAEQFCRSVKDKLHTGDLFLIGFDLKKNPHTILHAYNDSAGITASFNLNLLSRMNRELEADFKLDQFQHYQHYDPISGACKSFLVSLCRQEVRVADTVFTFEENELIDMEISQKFSEADIKRMALYSGFRIISEVKDSKEWFVDSIWQAL